MISVVIPLLNEEDTVGELLSRVCATMEARGEPFEVVLVDDASRDGTPLLLREAATRDPRLRVVTLASHAGQLTAVARGLFATRGGVAVTLDGDLQDLPEDIPRLLDAIAAGASVATGYRTARHEGLARWLLSRAVHWLARAMTGVAIDDFGGNFKAYRREVIEAVGALWTPGHPFFPLALARAASVAEVPVQRAPRRAGATRYSLRSSFLVVVGLWRLRRTLTGGAPPVVLRFPPHPGADGGTGGRTPGAGGRSFIVFVVLNSLGSAITCAIASVAP